MISITAGVLRSALLCTSKNDVRYYFDGLHVKQNRIESTNGQICYRAIINSDEDRILNFKNVKLPTKFTHADIDGNEITFYDKTNAISKMFVTDIDARYPDIDRLFNQQHEFIDAIAFNGKYLQIIGRIACYVDPKFGFSKFIFGVDNTAGVTVRFTDAHQSEIIVMPMRING